MKTESEHFHDWEQHVFGFGYGSGEEHVLPVVKQLLSLADARGCFDYTILERELSPPIAWLLLNTFCHAQLLEYGTSSRFPWLTAEGRALKQFVDAHTAEQLADLTERSEDYYECHPTYCNCDDGPCKNPFWIARR